MVETTELKKNYNTDSRLLTDTYNAVLSDDFNFIIFWGPARKSKTTLAGWVLHNLYNNDWNKVLMAFAWNLDQTITRIEKGIPEKVWTTNGFHNRVPGVCWDDFAASAGKATSQYDKAFDELKGGFDVMGTSVTNIMLTMLDPASITNQLMWKYTHEVQLLEKGVYKFDSVTFQQDFHGWKPRVKKVPIETNTFDRWPTWVYQEYDQIRMSLVPQVFQKIRDAQKMSKLDTLMQLVNAEDINLLRLIQVKGPMTSTLLSDEMGENGKTIITRCKSRSLINPMRCGDNYYKMELGYLGIEILKALDKDKDIEREIKNREQE